MNKYLNLKTPSPWLSLPIIKSCGLSSNMTGSYEISLLNDFTFSCVSVGEEEYNKGKTYTLLKKFSIETDKTWNTRKVKGFSLVEVKVFTVFAEQNKSLGCTHCEYFLCLNGVPVNHEPLAYKKDVVALSKSFKSEDEIDLLQPSSIETKEEAPVEPASVETKLSTSPTEVLREVIEEMKEEETPVEALTLSEAFLKDEMCDDILRRFTLKMEERKKAQQESAELSKLLEEHGFSTRVEKHNHFPYQVQVSKGGLKTRVVSVDYSWYTLETKGEYYSVATQKDVLRYIKKLFKTSCLTQ